MPAALLSLALAAPASAASLHVGVPGRYFTPPRVEAVAGDTVTWHNSSGEAHDVAGERMNPGERGLAPVHRAGLRPVRVRAAPVDGGGGRRRARRAERPAAGAGGRRPGGPHRAGRRRGRRAVVGGPRRRCPSRPCPPRRTGRFRVEAPSQSATFRADTDRGASREVRVDVVDRVAVGLTARLGKHLTTLEAHDAPAPPRARRRSSSSGRASASRGAAPARRSSTARGGRRSRSTAASAAARGSCSSRPTGRRWRRAARRSRGG